MSNMDSRDSSRPAKTTCTEAGGGWLLGKDDCDCD
jgi:hypothetical protein